MAQRLQPQDRQTKRSEVEASGTGNELRNAEPGSPLTAEHLRMTLATFWRLRSQAKQLQGPAMRLCRDP
jgi:hypothetical protein